MTELGLCYNEPLRKMCVAINLTRTEPLTMFGYLCDEMFLRSVFLYRKGKPHCWAEEDWMPDYFHLRFWAGKGHLFFVRAALEEARLSGEADPAANQVALAEIQRWCWMFDECGFDDEELVTFRVGRELLPHREPIPEKVSG